MDVLPAPEGMLAVVCVQGGVCPRVSQDLAVVGILVGPSICASFWNWRLIESLIICTLLSRGQRLTCIADPALHSRLDDRDNHY